MVLKGLHPLEPDFAERGVWIERRVQFPLASTASGRVSVTGLHFPKLIAAQHGSAELQLSFLAGGSLVHRATLREHGPFTVQFTVEPQPGQGGPSELSVVCDRSFVPAQIGDGSDQRELCVRIKSLRVGNMLVLDCSRRINFLGFASGSYSDGKAPIGREIASADSALRFHLDTPHMGLADQVDGRFVTSGWACDLASLSAVAVRVVLGQRIFATSAVSRQDVQMAFADAGPLPPETGFLVTLQPPVGTVQLRVEAQLSSGAWTVQRYGFVLTAPPQRRLPGGTMGHWFTAALPQALLSRTLDHLRSARHDKSVAALPDSFRFHLDAPQVGKLNVVGAECVVSGWAFDEKACASVPVRVVVGSRTHAVHAKQREDVQKAFRSLGELPLSTGFVCLLTLPAGLHRIQIEIRTPDGDWVPVRRARLLRVPGLGLRHRAPQQRTLRAYLRAQRKYHEQELPEVQRHVQVMLERPHFLVLIDSCDLGPALKATLRSIENQIYPYHTVQVRTPGPEKVTPAWAAAASPILTEFSVPEVAADFVVILQSGECLMPRALYEFAAAINHNSEIDLIYADELMEQGRGQAPMPFYKPDWSPDYLETFNYLGFAACFRARLILRCIDAIGRIHPYDLALRITEQTNQIHHIAQILGHKTPAALPDRSTAARDIAAISARLARTGRSGSVVEHPLHKGCYATTLRLRRTPLVSIVIPTAGKTIALDGREIDLLANVIDQIHGRSSYKNLEIIIVDNGDLSSVQLAFLHQHGCKRVTYAEPVFNISKKLNLGVTLALGDMLLLMNDDIEVLAPEWIERMLEQFEKPHVGVVGGKLLYPDGRTQHVGVVHNSGNPDHVRRLYPRQDAGYFYSSCGVRNFGAVTGACMMTPSRVYREVGGYSEALAVSYNDADYCLKVGQLGLSIVYAPAVELTHMESQSRVASADPVEVAWYRMRWAEQVVSDRFYNERFLTVASPTFVPCVNVRLV